MEMSYEEVEDMARHPHGQEPTIKVLRVPTDGSLPVNVQVGPTCGIYALDAAFALRGKRVAPPRKHQFNDEAAGDWRQQGIARTASIRGFAKSEGLTQTGEIGGCRDMLALAAGLGVECELRTFSGPDSLWQVVRSAVDNGKSVVFPYNADDDSGAPGWKSAAGGFAHWTLLFGYHAYQSGRHELQRILMTTYGRYHRVSPYRLFKANQHIQDWPRQTWIKLTLWAKPPGERWEVWQDAWQGQDTLTADLTQMARSTGAGWGFGLGDKSTMLHAILEPPRLISPNVSVPAHILHKATAKQADLNRVEYTKTMRGQCVVV
ncbi:MAG: hypothetical protein KDH15_14230 [Rhodocyclaceae bacterium]|nr:hypothetical protein [Rhodocyclaceae bacterium]